MAADAPTLATRADPTAGDAWVTRERVTDPVTGLPLLRYRFAGPPTLRPGMPAPAGAWRVLRVDERDGLTTLDLETAAGAEPLDVRPSGVDDGVVEAALHTVRLAFHCGVVHGDLGPQRLWRRGEQVWVEGYGVRWRDGSDAQADVRDLASGLLRLPGTRLSPAMRARLGAIVHRGDVDATAEAPVAGAPDASAGDLPVVTGVDPVPPVVRHPPPGSRVRSGGTGMRAIVAAAAPEWATTARRTAARIGGATAAALGRVAQRLQPRVTTVAATWTEPGLDPRRRRSLAVALAIGALAWFALASWSARIAVAPLGSAAPVAGHVVDVSVDPEGQPPVSLVVLASPSGSRFAPGSVIASVPSKVWLDLDGRWRFEARFGDRRSPAVDLILPFERVLRLAFPQPAAP